MGGSDAGLSDPARASQTPRQLPAPRYALEAFEAVRELGKGSFGVVREVRRKHSEESFAMKLLDKRVIVERGLQEQLRREVLIQLKVKHPHVVKLVYYFEDASNIYCLLEYADRGQLFRYLRDKDCGLPERELSHFFADVARGVAYLHDGQIVHRDLKPENVLLFGPDRRAKICDFGWCVELTPAEPTRLTFCGTLDYLPPEMVRGAPHGLPVDLWALGVLLFEMAMARAPFSASSQKETMEAICEVRYAVPPGEVPAHVEVLIRDLLVDSPSRRVPAARALERPWLAADKAAAIAAAASARPAPAPEAAAVRPTTPRKDRRCSGPSIPAAELDETRRVLRSAAGYPAPVPAAARPAAVEIPAAAPLVAAPYAAPLKETRFRANCRREALEFIMDSDLLSTVDDSRISLEDIDEQLRSGLGGSCRVVIEGPGGGDSILLKSDSFSPQSMGGEDVVVRCVPRAKQKSVRRPSTVSSVGMSR